MKQRHATLRAYVGYLLKFLANPFALPPQFAHLGDGDMRRKGSVICTVDAYTLNQMLGKSWD